ncbi:MAG: hypothetical protein WCY54_06005, partial [Syntrophales bacterium]
QGYIYIASLLSEMRSDKRGKYPRLSLHWRDGKSDCEDYSQVMLSAALLRAWQVAVSYMEKKPLSGGTI